MFFKCIREIAFHSNEFLASALIALACVLTSFIIRSIDLTPLVLLLGGIPSG